MRVFLGFLVPVIMIICAVPLAFRRVPPNEMYGFRIAKTLRSPDVWFKGNQFAGWCLLAAGIVSLLVTLHEFRELSDVTRATEHFQLGALLVAAAVSAAYVKML
jgi:uncharacterized membrane protein